MCFCEDSKNLQGHFRPTLSTLASKISANRMGLTQSDWSFLLIMRGLLELRGMFGLLHTTILIMGFLTATINGGCTSEYHQRHELQVSGSTVEQHDIFDTFSSVVQIMLIAKQQLIRTIDDDKNIVMSRRDCKIIGDGLSYRDIHGLNDSYDAIAKLSRDIIVGNQIMVNGDTTSTLVSMEQHWQILDMMNLQQNINPAGDHTLIVVKNGPDSIITNYDNWAYRDMDVLCTISQDYLNINTILLPSLRELHKIFNNILAAVKIFPQVLDTRDIRNCLGMNTLDFWSIMEINEDILEKCLNEHGDRDKRSLLAWLDGSQAQIDSVANALDATIDTFNEDLEHIESFNRQVASGYNHLQLEMSSVEGYINSLRDVVILEEIKSDIRERKSFYHRMRLTQSINYNNIVLNSDTTALMKVINNCLFGELTCTISNCETKLNCGIAKNSDGKDVLEIHREYAQLKSSEGFLISCVPVSPTKISSWHGHLAAGYGNSSVVIEKKIINMEDLASDEIVNAQLRPIEEREKVLGNFIILPSKIICLDQIPVFSLNGKSISCESLQIIEVDTNYTLILGENSYTHLQKTLSHKRSYKLERGVYREMTTNLDSFQGDAMDTFIETIFLNKVGHVSHEKSAAFGTGMFVLAVIIFIICYWKCPCCRTWVQGCFYCCMPDSFLIWREKRAEEALEQEEERAVRLDLLERSASQPCHPNAAEGNHHQVPASAPPPDDAMDSMAPGAGLLPQSSSAQQQ